MTHPIRNKNYQILADRAEGAYLQRNYLDAFLLQSCLVEGVLKIYCRQKLSHRMGFRDKIEQFGLSTLIDVLYAASAIDTQLFKELHTYRKARNKVIHELLKYENNGQMNEEMKNVYELGRGMKGYIVEDMIKNVGNQSVAEANVTIESLIAQLGDLQKQIVELNPSFGDKIRKMFEDALK